MMVYMVPVVVKDSPVAVYCKFSGLNVGLTVLNRPERYSVKYCTTMK